MNLVRLAETEVALKLHSMMANYMANSWLQKGAWKATCAKRDEGTMESLGAMGTPGEGACILMVYGVRRVRDVHWSKCH